MTLNFGGGLFKDRNAAANEASAKPFPVDLPVDIMDASRRVLIRGMHDN